MARKLNPISMLTPRIVSPWQETLSLYGSSSAGWNGPTGILYGIRLSRSVNA
jgi:hypothetical protein